MEKNMTTIMVMPSKWAIVAYLLITSIISVGCRKESKFMDITNVCNSVDKLTTISFLNRTEVEKQLGVELTPAEGNEYFSFFEYKGELPAFPNSTHADVRISNDEKGRGFIWLTLQPPTCTTIRTVIKKYPRGERTFASPNNLSPDATNNYKIHVNNGTLSFGFNVKSGCLTRLIFDKTE
jgi:hypothetical protein